MKTGTMALVQLYRTVPCDAADAGDAAILAALGYRARPCDGWIARWFGGRCRVVSRCVGCDRGGRADYRDDVGPDGV